MAKVIGVSWWCYPWRQLAVFQGCPDCNAACKCLYGLVGHLRGRGRVPGRNHARTRPHALPSVSGWVRARPCDRAVPAQSTADGKTCRAYLLAAGKHVAKCRVNLRAPSFVYRDTFRMRRCKHEPSSPETWPFDVSSIEACPVPQGLSKYDCKAMRHDADIHTQGGCVAPRRNVSLLLAGDSITSQLAWVARCAALPGVKISSFELIAVPPTDALHEWLQMALNTFDVLVLNVGLWYNWSPSSLANASVARMVDEISANWTEVKMRGCPATRSYVDGSIAPEDTFRSKWSQLSSESQRWPGKWSSPSTLPYAQARERCRTFQALGHQAYVSDLKRLAAALHRLESASGSPIGQRVAWMSTTAQHYHGTVGGVFDPAVLDRRRWPFASGQAYCAPIKSSEMWAARGRNELAEAALRDARLHFLNVWDSDLRYHDQHTRVANDCSHGCLHSNLMNGKLHALGSKLCEILQLRPRRRALSIPAAPR